MPPTHAQAAGEFDIRHEPFRLIIFAR